MRDQEMINNLMDLSEEGSDVLDVRIVDAMGNTRDVEDMRVVEDGDGNRWIQIDIDDPDRDGLFGATEL